MKSYWIWNYGDYEILHSNRVNSRRQDLGSDVPPFWKLYDAEKMYVFIKKLKLKRTDISNYL